MAGMKMKIGSALAIRLEDGVKDLLFDELAGKEIEGLDSIYRVAVVPTIGTEVRLRLYRKEETDYIEVALRIEASRG